MKGSCKFCTTWNNPPRGSKQRIKDDSGKTSSCYFCPFVRRDIKANSPGCSNLEVTPWFYCEKKFQRVTAKVCINNQRKQTDSDCKLCFQGKELLDLLRGQTEDPRNAPIFPNFKKEKPKLRRRNA